MKTTLRHGLAITLAVYLTLAWCLPLAHAYVEISYSLGRVVNESTNVMLLRVESVDKEKNLIIYRKVSDIKGKHPTEVVKHNIGRGGFHPREWQNIMAWAEPGKTAVFMHNGGASETCIDGYWYQAYAGGEWWSMSHAEPYLLRSFAGKPDKLATAVTAMLAGQEVIVPCMVDGDKNALQLRTARIQRLKASLKLAEYNAQRDFVGWGGDDFRSISGMPGFSHYAGVARVDPGAAGVSVQDIDGDGQPEFLFYGAKKVALLKVAGTSLEEISLPYTGGARSAAWADYNGDGKPDLLLATSSGPKLLTNQGKGVFKDDSARLPPEAYYNLTAAAWIDYDNDKRPDILLANGYLGLRLYHNLGPAAAAKPLLFQDISEIAGLGPNGLASHLKGDHLLVADVNGDGFQDFLYSAGSGLLAVRSGKGFVDYKQSGIAFQSGGVTPLFLDVNGDGKPDLFVPQASGCKLFVNDGKARFTDVSAKSGDLAKPLGRVTCAAVCDFDANGKPDLFLGCFKGGNRYLRNNGDGTFTDASDRFGFHQKIFNSRGLALADINKDGVPDLLLANEGQESAVLLGAPKKTGGEGLSSR